MSTGEPSPNQQPDPAAEGFFYEARSEDDEPLFSLEEIESGPDYIEKVMLVPLPVTTMAKLIDALYEQLRPIPLNTKRSQLLFQQIFAGELKKAADRLVKNKKPGDHVTYDDLDWLASEKTGHFKRPVVDEITGNTTFVAETDGIAKIRDRFVALFDQTPTLEGIATNIDEWTVHPQIHKYQQARVEAHPNGDFYEEAFGHKGRWTCENRDGFTIWRPQLPSNE